MLFGWSAKLICWVARRRREALSQPRGSAGSNPLWSPRHPILRKPSVRACTGRQVWVCWCKTVRVVNAVVCRSCASFQSVLLFCCCCCWLNSEKGSCMLCVCRRNEGWFTLHDLVCLCTLLLEVLHNYHTRETWFIFVAEALKLLFVITCYYVLLNWIKYIYFFSATWIYVCYVYVV